MEQITHDAVVTSTGASMTSNKNTDGKKPGEKEPGKSHYNPGNMSGKKAGMRKESEQEKSADPLQSREKLQERD
jgi:hypothetical protein